MSLDYQHLRDFSDPTFSLLALVLACIPSSPLAVVPHASIISKEPEFLFVCLFLFLRQGLYIALVEAASLPPVLGFKVVATTHLAKDS